MERTAKSWAMLHAKCPRCRRGNMFEGATYSLGSNRINLNCPHCQMVFEIEPGYFYAAMYVSYAMNVAEGGFLWVATFLITGNNDSPWLYLATILGGLFVLSPLNFRYSRVILLYWLSPKVHYRPELDTDTPIDGNKYKWFQ
jgi:phage FluMu protein Com